MLASVSISKAYGHVQALNDVSVDVHRGEVVAIFGDNGAGKSTLAKCLCGVTEPDSGRIESESGPVVLHSIRDAEALGITAVHQDLALAPDLTVLENMFLGHELVRTGWPGLFGVVARRAMAERSAEALAGLAIKLPSVRTPVRELSGGQKQAVAVARAAMWTRSGILMDEPTAALGTLQSDIVCELIRTTAKKGLGILVISHDIPRVMEVADTVVVLRHGRVALCEPAHNVARRDIIDAMVGYSEAVSGRGP
ncbi:MAG TPA: ATP-binding cassette domain-containing protein [Acidimicrobiales bacterium]|nr:ATP-binding cassette domain-containing protein [Acidimicrobiales bacterium]